MARKTSETPGSVAESYVEDVSRSLTPPAGCQRKPQPEHFSDRLLEREPAAIRDMFGEIAHRYDVLNRLLSLRRDVGWRRKLVEAIAWAPEGNVLDLATGTGDVALAARGRRIVGGDFCLDMLALAGRKARRRRRDVAWTAADALCLPFADGAFAAVTIAFGVRNFADLAGGFREIRRVLVPSGVLAILELQRPRLRAMAAAMAVWNRLVVVPVGRLISPDGDAYAYLPASVDTFPDRVEMAGVLAAQGFAMISSTDLSGGIAGLTVARREGQ
jgi:demethylmenaquinone methyltransferase/2-methoxy-6-polyprenyl-1,4-benzoquinol methylase